MTDQPTPSSSSTPVPGNPGGGSNGRANGRGSDARPPASPAVRSGLAQRRNPVLASLGAFAHTVRRVALRDPVALFLLLASIGLAIAFATLLGDIKPSSSGVEVPINTVQTLATHKDVANALLLDHDNRVELVTSTAAPRLSLAGEVPPSTPRTVRTPVTVKGKRRIRVSTVLVPAPGAGIRQPLWAAYPASGAQTQQLLHELLAGGATVAVDQQSGKGTKTIIVQFLIPILLLVCLFSLFMRLGAEGAAGGIAGFSEFTGKGRKKGKGTRDKHHVRRRRRRGRGGGRAARDPRLSGRTEQVPERWGRPRPRACCWSGLRGPARRCSPRRSRAKPTRRSSRSRARTSWSRWWASARRACATCSARRARRRPAIIFIDELDAAGRKRGAGIGQGNDEREQTLNQILVEMDGFAGDGGLVVMGATNRPDILDPALLRPGRFDRQVVVDVPDVHGRLEILRLHGGKRPLAPDASLEEVARQTPGFSGAELANVINEAALLSVRDGRGEIDQATLEEAIDRVVAGPAKRHILTEQERWLIAIHEASHAVVTDALGHTTSTRKLSIVARGRQLGTAAHMLTDRDQVIMSEPDLQSQLIVITAGLAGERIAFGHTSTSVNDDLHAATALAR